MPDKKVVDVPERADAGAEVPADPDRYKGLQRELEKARRAEREANRRAMEAEQARLGYERVEELLIRLAADQDETVATEAKQRREVSKKLSEWQREFNEILDSADASPDDERFAPALQLWQKGEHAAAVAAARKAVQAEPLSEDRLSQLIEERVTARLRELSQDVDRGGPAGATGKVRRGELTRATSKLTGRAATGRDAAAEAERLLNRIYGQT